MDTMTVEEWIETYQPIVNHLDPEASWQEDGKNGIMFETYGDEREFVIMQNPYTVWSYRDDEYDGSIITVGMAQSAIGYFITIVPWSPDMEPNYIQVIEREVV